MDERFVTDAYLETDEDEERGVNYPTVEVYITDITKREIIEINFGARIESLNREKAMGLADAIIHALITYEKSCQEAMVKKNTCPNCGENSWKECIHGIFCVYCQTQYSAQTCVHGVNLANQACFTCEPEQFKYADRKRR